VTRHDMPDDEPNADPPSPEDPWSVPPPPPVGWGGTSGTPPAVTPPWSAPPPYQDVDETGFDRPYAAEAPANPWHIPPQPRWDPAAEPPPAERDTVTDPPAEEGWDSPATDPSGWNASAYRPAPPAVHGPPAADATALDLPPSATSPRSTPRPPASRLPGSAESGQRPSVPPLSSPGGPPAVYDEPWRRDAAQRPSGRGVPLRPLLLGVAGAVVVALVAGGVFMLTRGGGHHAPAGPAAQLARTLFAPDPAARADGRDQELSGVAASGSTVVAVGGEVDTTDYRGEFLVSTDGGRTFRLGDVRTTGGDEASYGYAPQHVAGADGAWVALGVSPGGGVVWTSHDGRSWTLQQSAAGAPFSGASRVAQITRTASGFVAVGTTSAKGDFSDLAPVVWRSTDGTRWDRLDADRLKISAKGERATLDAVSANGDTVVAHGWTASGTRKSDITEGFWRSTDGGATWGSISTPHPDDSKLTVGAAFLAYGPGGFLIARDAKKKGGTPYAVLMSSADGRQWAPAGEIHVPGYTRLQQLIGSDQAWAAVATTGSTMTITRSADGRSWANAGTVPLPHDRTVTGVAATAAATLVTGRDGTDSGNDAVLAARAPNGQEIPVDLARVPGAVQADQAVSTVASAGGRVVAVGSTNGDAAVWSSADGRSWTRAQAEGSAFGGANAQRLVGLAGGRSGWVAVGFSGAAPRHALVLTSGDGTRWSAANDKVFTSANQVDTTAATSGPAGYVVVGDDGRSAAVWHSSDLKKWDRGSGTTQDAMDGTLGAERWMHSIVSGPFGYVAVGGLNDPSVRGAPTGKPAVWTSADGEKWALQQLPLPSGTTEATLDQVAIEQNVLTAAGTAKTASGTTVFAFTSADGGKTWKQAALPRPGSGDSAVTAVAATPKGFVVAGTRTAHGDADVAIWTSQNGVSWQVETPTGTGLSGAGDQWLTGLTTVGGDLLATGITRDRTGEQPTLWRRPLP
jgi:hypothetical protein